MIQASFRRAHASSASRRGSDIVIPSGACWPGVKTASAAPAALRTPAATSSPSASTGTAVTVIPAKPSAVRVSGKPGSSCPWHFRWACPLKTPSPSSCGHAPSLVRLGGLRRRRSGIRIRVAIRTCVERTIAWLNRCRRLSKDWECLNRNALAFLRWASVRLMLRRLCKG